MNIKEKLPLILGITIFIILCGISYYYIFERDYTYYTMIDNTKIKEISSSDDMKYQYKLVMYDKNGASKTIKFKTVRVLKENAYLKIKYYKIGGVNKWEEITYDDLPNKVKEHYKN